MIEFLFKLTIMGTLLLSLFAILFTIPSFIGLIGVAFSDYGSVSSNITNGFAVISGYTRPWLGLLNLMIGESGRTALTSLILWRISKPIVYKVMGPLELAIEKLVEKS